MTDAPGHSLAPSIGGSPLVKGIAVNIETALILVSEDKLKLCLNEYDNSDRARLNWVAPLGIFLTCFVAVLACNFKPRFGLSGPTWEALFIIVMVLAALATLSLLARAFRQGKTPIEELIRKIKTDEAERSVEVGSSPVSTGISSR